MPPVVFERTQGIPAIIAMYCLVGALTFVLWRLTKPHIKIRTWISLGTMTFLAMVIAGNAFAYTAHHYGPNTQFGTTADAASAYELDSGTAYPAVLGTQSTEIIPTTHYFLANGLEPDADGALYVSFWSPFNDGGAFRLPREQITLHPGATASLAVTFADEDTNYHVTVERNYSGCKATIYDFVLICRQKTISKITTVSGKPYDALNGRTVSATLTLPPADLASARATLNSTLHPN